MPVAVILIVLVLIGVGVVLIRAGFWPKRIGEEAFCRRCGYSLRGLSSNRCPECGTLLSPANVLRGIRRRRSGLGWLGILLLVLGLGILVSVLSDVWDEIDWYHFKPTFLVMQDMNPVTGPTATQAVTELLRREADGDLSESNRQKLIQFALVQQGGTLSNAAVDALIKFLGDEAAAKKLSDSQKQLFGSQCMQLRTHHSANGAGGRSGSVQDQ